MRNLRWCVLVLLAPALLLAGCGNPQKEARQRLADQVEQARRLLGHATRLLANPVLYERSASQAASKPAPIDRKLRAEELALPSSPPVENKEAEDLLRQARKLLTDALAAEAAAPTEAKADARMLLGEISVALGNYYGTAAGHCLQDAGAARQKATSLLRVADNNLTLIQFDKALAGLSPDQIQALRTKTAGELKETEDKLKAAEDEMAAKNQEIQRLSQDFDKLAAQASGLRDQADKAGGEKGLDLFRQAQTVEKQKDANAAQIAADQQRVETLQVDKIFLEGLRQAGTGKQAAIDSSLKNMADFKQKSDREIQAAQAQLAQTEQAADGAAGAVAEQTRAAASWADKAVAAYTDAVKALGEAVGGVEATIKAAEVAARQSTEKPNELVKGMQENNHLVAAVALKGSASLGLADLRVRQVDAAAGNANLAKDLGTIWKKDGKEPPAAAKDLTATDPAETRKVAQGNYEDAVKDLKTAQSAVATGPGVKTAWIYQGQLADAYLGLYRLTGDPRVRTDAQALVDSALRNKETSPYLEPVLRLQRLLNLAAPTPEGPAIPARPATPATPATTAASAPAAP